MTNDEINKAIAEACGWWGNCKENCMRPPNCTDMYCEIPNYCHDLNAMHEAEKLLETADQQNRYYAEIANITWCNLETGNRQVVFNQLTATAHQRAEAFLRTLNLWTE